MSAGLEHVAEGSKDEFRKGHEPWGRDVWIVDLERIDVAMKSRDEASVILHVLWQRPDEAELRTTELTQSYKPQPRAYLGACELLDLDPAEVMMCAAHNDDLRAARSAGLKAAFFARPTEYGPHQSKDFEASEEWDVIAFNIGDLASRMGC
jgi:beta-phosphoglucomutase-like phosphatase (HAD superfamily)